MNDPGNRLDGQDSTELLPDLITIDLMADEWQQYLVTVDKRQNVQHGCDVRMVMAGGFFEVFKGLLAKRHSHLVATLRCVLNDEVVQGSKPGRNFVARIGGVG